MNKRFLIFASLAGAVAVVAGAMLAHFLRQRMPAAALDVYETAVRYQFYHVFALLACGILSERFRGFWMNMAGTCFIGGRYILIGLQKEELVFRHPEFHKRETTLMSSRNATREDFDHVIETIKKGLIHPLSFITNRVDFRDAATEFKNWANPAGSIIKVMLEKE